MNLLSTRDPSRNHACYYDGRIPPERIVGSMERVKSMLVGTAFDRPLRAARWAFSLFRLWQHPDLHAYRCEERIVTQLIERLVQPGWNCIDVGSHLGSSLADFVRMAPHRTNLAS